MDCIVSGGEMFDNITHDRYNGDGVGERLSKFYAYQMLSAMKVLLSAFILRFDPLPDFSHDNCTTITTTNAADVDFFTHPFRL